MLHKLIIIGLMWATLLGCSESEPQTTSGLKVGENFPNLSLVSLEGAKASLSDFAGKVVVVNVWATWCGPCRKELPSLESLDQLLEDEAFAVLALSIDEDVLLVREYLSDKNINLPVYFHEEGPLDYAALGINVFPYTFVVAPNGQLVERHPGEKVWNSVEIVENIRSFTR